MRRGALVFVVYTVYAIPPHFLEDSLRCITLKSTFLLLEVQSKEIIRVVPGDVRGCFCIVCISEKLDVS